MVADYYDYEMNCVERHVFNSDGANWFQKNMVPYYIFQLDLYHRNKGLKGGG